MIASMIFFPEKTFYEKPGDYGLESEDIFLAAADGVKLHGWFLLARKERGVILFFHGNAGNISGRLHKAKGWVERGFSVFLLDYRGYGKSGGAIEHAEDLMLDANAAWDWLAQTRKVELSKIILYGESLGTHPAIRLGAGHKVAAVVLEAPFTSFLELGRLHYPFVPPFVLKNFEFPNTKYIADLKAPLFILHGTEDEICPYAMSGEIFERAPEPKGFLSIPNGMHNDLPMKAGGDFWEKPAEFVEKYLKL